MAGISIEVRDDELRHRLDGLVLKARNLRPAFTEIGGMMLTGTQHRFEDQRDPDGKAWAPLSFPTLLGRAGRGRKIAERGKVKGVEYVKLTARAERRVDGAKALLDSGRLFKSVTFRADGQSVEVGSNLVYARIHQLGGKAGRGRKVTIAARPYLGFNAADRGASLRILGRHFGEDMA
jgi:phage gpG-like protein